MPPPVRRRRQSIIRGFAAVALVASVFAVTLSTSGSPRADASLHLVPCSLGALRINLVSNAGLGHGAFRVVVRNDGPMTCSLSGYPRLIVPLDDRRDPSVQRSYQRVMPPGRRANVRDTTSTYAGGYDGPVTTSGRVALPTVVLAPRTGVASFNIVWIEISPKACPIALKLEIGLRGHAAYVTSRQVLFMCSDVNVTPFAPGDTGSWS
jgi:hypothetical protein